MQWVLSLHTMQNYQQLTRLFRKLICRYATLVIDAACVASNPYIFTTKTTSEPCSTKFRCQHDVTTMSKSTLHQHSTNAFSNQHQLQRQSIINNKIMSSSVVTQQQISVNS